MKKLQEALHPRYIVDTSGKKIAVILDNAVFEQLMTALEDLHLGALADEIIASQKKFHDFDAIKKQLME